MPPAGDWYLVQNAPAVIQWTPEDGLDRHFGCEHPEQACQVFADIGFDASQHTSLLRLRVPVGVKEAGRNKTSLYVFCRPEHICALEKLDNATPVVSNAFIAKTKQCTSADEIISLRVVLAQTATVIGPAGMPKLTPKTEAFGNILRALQSLAVSTRFTVSMKRNDALASHLDTLCEEAGKGSLIPSAKEHALDMLYRGAGGEDVGHLLAQFDLGNPPSYDQVGSTPPAPDYRGSGKRPRSSGHDSPPLKKRVPSHNKLEDSLNTAMAPWKTRLSDLELELAMLRGQVAAQEAPPSPTEDASVADRLDRFEDEVRSLRTKLEQVESMVQQHNSGSGSSMMDMVQQCLDERFEDAKDETAGEIDAQLDDKLIDFKVELKDWAVEELRDLVAQELPEILRESLDTASFSINVNINGR